MKFGMLPVKPILLRERDCRLVRAPMAVGILAVLVHEPALMPNEVTLLFEQPIPLQ